MAKYDIMPFTSSPAESARVVSVLLDASAAFEMGDVVQVHANGDLVEGSDEQDVEGTLAGIACADATATALARNGSSVALAAAAGVQAEFWCMDPGTEWITDEVNSDDDTTLDETPAVAMIGDLGTLRTDGTTWGLCLNSSASNRNFAVTRILDIDKRDVTTSGNTGVYLVFKRIS